MTERKYLNKPDKQDNRDLLFAVRGVATPYEVDLRPKDAAGIFDQGYLGSCTANAICAFVSYLDKNFTYPSRLHFNYSVLFLYWKEREIEGTIDYDSGAYIRDGMKVAQKIGLAAGGTYPTEVSEFRSTPTQEAYDTAKHHKITEYRRLNANTPAQLKESLANGFPVVMGIEIYSSFEGDEVALTGVVPMPDRQSETFLGGHAVLAMGYTHIDGKEYIICRNSWGKGWGDKGYFYLPMDFVGRMISDMWTGR
ncbi:C1 family peptidase [Paenibacillus sedimenti]|uniref:C1 family peptidase n=1 Tax=Paenibacillus sedimenti TaxID=2770274 RepID=A0A926KNT6_9BACL|nr:C1 family peptidase [Paenibacillus sedimenti]MBD0381272.1 C1 family peptidase [Paenibacillus sedimenti]